MRKVSTGMRLLALCVTYAVLRLASSLGRPIATFPDTTGYISSGSDSHRSGVVRFLFTIVTTNTSRVALQALLGIVAWCIAAWIISALTRFPTTAAAAVLALGLLPQVVRYDLAVLSESIGISIAVLTVAFAVQFAARRTIITGSLFAVSAVLLGSVRASYFVAVCGTLIVIALMAIQHRSVAMYTTAAILILGATWNYQQTANDKGISNLNMYTVLMSRVVTNDSRYSWFVEHGMPDVPGAREAVSYDNIGTLEPLLAQQLELPVDQAPPSLMRVGGASLATWVASHGWSTWFGYLRHHPHDALRTVTPLLGPTLSPSDDSFLPINSRTIIPRQLFLPWEWWAIIVGAGIVGLSLSQRRIAAGLFIIVCGVASTFVMTALTSGIEHPRHMAAIAVVVRLVAVFAVVPLFPCRTSPETSTPENSPRSRRGRSQSPSPAE